MSLDISTGLRVAYIAHGGGPLPLLGDPNHVEIVANLQMLAGLISKPDAIVVVSAHWEESLPTITAGAQPELIYDYYNFPPEAYQITYPAAGAPQLAATIQQLFMAQEIDSVLDSERGFDHGLFVPLKIMYPQADIPCVQVSLLGSLDAGAHIKLGEALTGLAEVSGKNILLIGSGFSFHNMKEFFNHSAEGQQKNAEFEAWLIDTCANTDLDQSTRAARLTDWQKAPSARFCHPREEHLLPLQVCYGAAGRACTQYFELTALGKKASVYLW